MILTKRAALMSLLLIAMSDASPSWAGLLGLKQISVDSTTGPAGQHRTEVDPSQAAYERTIVTTFQDGELTTNGALRVGWATSHDAGQTWKHGYIPGTTDNYWVQVVAFDRKHLTWLITMMPQDANQNTLGMQISRSVDGLNWTAPEWVYGPVNVDNEGTDRPWIACDNSPSSPHFGNCYVAWRDFALVNGNCCNSTNMLAVSHDGGFAWGVPAVSPDQAAGSIGAVTIQRNGHLFLIGAYGGPDLPQLYSIESPDGGRTLNQSIYISTEYFNFPGQGLMRADPFPSAGVSSNGTIYVVTADCRFRTNCVAGGNTASVNDLVYTTSKDGRTWTPITAIPIDADGSVDHFITGVAVGGSAKDSWDDRNFWDDEVPHDRLAVSYYYLTDAPCDPKVANAVCRLRAGFISSPDGGKTWTAPVQVSGPMNVLDLAQTEFGYFVANDITAIYVEGEPQAAYSIALPPDRRTGGLNQSIYSARFRPQDR
ncbi:MAG: sialidase family protein [Gammaproteobacteria bacterium]